ncbi:MAG TPA: hypothetical protein VGH28_05920 [Polyangiaceae bacterium]|jgi:hypothetical protein
MRRVAVVLILLGCNETQPASTVTVAPLPTNAATASASATATASESATVTAAASAPAAPTVDRRCSPGQLDVPCVFQTNGKCFVRRSNCTALPCTESAPAEVSCDVFAKARAATPCDVVRSCQGISDEGCVVNVGCHAQMATCIEKSCAPKILAATVCRAIPSSCIK